MLILRKARKHWLNLHILRKDLCHFYAKCASIGQFYTYCVYLCHYYTKCVIIGKIYTYCVKSLCFFYAKMFIFMIIKCQMSIFTFLMSFYSVYAILSRIRLCRDLHFFCVNFKGPNLRLRNFFWQISSLSPMLTAVRILTVYLVSSKRSSRWRKRKKVGQWL